MKRMNHGSKGESIQLCVHVCLFVYVRSNIYILASHHNIAHTAPHSNRRLRAKSWAQWSNHLLQLDRSVWPE